MTEKGLKMRETFRKKYGVDHPSQLPSFKEKLRIKREEGAYDNVVLKMRETLKKKYGNENYNNLDKAKQTKFKKYGNENYNNREKMIQTNLERYGKKVSPNTIERTRQRAIDGHIGFKSKKFKTFLMNNNVTNISQLKEIKDKKKKKVIKQSIHNLFFGNRLKGLVKPLFLEEDYIGSTDYNKTYQFECCRCHHVFEDTLYSGNIPRCLKCYPHNRFKSKIEDEIVDFLNSNGINCVRHNRTVLNGEEIDILLFDKKIGIECNGIVWHSEIFGKKNKYYHQNKSNKAKENNISLIHIWDLEWINKKYIIKSILLNKLGMSRKIHARKCIIEEISNEQKQEFLEKNHLQGNDKSSIRIALIYNNIIISTMTFCKSRLDKKYQYEMSRYCNLLNTVVVGGANKLFQYFIMSYNPKSIISYCDKRFFDGNVYINIGMEKVGDTLPNYFYFNKNNSTLINRQTFQKHKLKAILPHFDPNLSEWQNMQLNGFDRIWDCGNLKYAWTNAKSEN